LKFFPAGTKEPVDYQQGRTSGDIIEFINQKAGLRGRVKTAPTAVVALEESNFDSVVLDTNKAVLVEFYAPWCGHCKKLAPDYEKVGETFASDSTVVVAKVDAESNRDLATKYGVTGYPTLKWFPRSDKSGVDYSGGRSPNDFIEFLNRETGAERVLGGGYSATAGRIDELDTLAAKLFASDSTSGAGVISEIEAALATDSIKSHKNAKFAQFYLTTAKKVNENKQFAVNEADRLKRMIEKGGVNAKNLESFHKRINIAAAFA